MASIWKRVGTYLGVVEDYEDEYDLPAEQPGQPRPSEPPPRSDPSNVRRIGPSPVRPHEPGDRGSSGSVGGYNGGYGGSHVRSEASTNSSAVRPVSSKVHVTDPTTFNEVEEVGERFRNGIPVIMNLAGASESVAKRMLDFASGLIFGLDGRIERVGDRVFLLTPTGVEVSTEERRRLSERGFFNQA